MKTNQDNMYYFRHEDEGPTWDAITVGGVGGQHLLAMLNDLHIAVPHSLDLQATIGEWLINRNGPTDYDGPVGAPPAVWVTWHVREDSHGAAHVHVAYGDMSGDWYDIR